MRIRELITHLKKLNPDAEVYIGLGMGNIDEAHKVSEFNKYFGERNKNGKEVIIVGEDYDIWDSHSNV